MESRTLGILSWLIVVAFSIQGGSAEAGFDAPGTAAFNLHADEHSVFDGFGLVSGRADCQAVSGAAFFSSDASDFGSDGVLIWAGFSFELGRAGPRHGMLLMDLDLAGADRGGFLGPASARIEYLETHRNRYVFEAQPAAAEIQILAERRSDDDGRLEIAFALILGDPDGTYPGCRVFLDGSVHTWPAPGNGSTRAVAEDDVVVETGCGGAGLEDDDWDDDSWDDDWDDDGSWEDDEEDWGFEGDTFDDDDDDDWEGDTFDEEESGLTAAGDAGEGHACATAGKPGGGGLLSGLLRFLPEAVGFGFIGWMRRSKRAAA